MRIKLETDAYYLILDKIQKREYKLVTSPVLFTEIESIKDIQEKYQLLYLLKKFSCKSDYDLNKAKERTEELIFLKFGIADSAHIAFAEQSANIFITCDDKLLNKSKKHKLKIITMNPIEFCNVEYLR